MKVKVKVFAGFSAGQANVGYSKSIDGDSYVTQTMSDFNGDKFPDYIRGGNVQLTAPVGKVSDEIVNIGDNFSHSKTSTEGPNFGGSYSHGAASNSSSITIAKSSVKIDSAKETASKKLKRWEQYFC